jgi:NAD(P)-dependent dehydrogenase (short-subunit alcohol dehydrogenase family)
VKYLTGRTALITGSTHGIGREVAITLAAAGARVAVHGRSAEAAAEVTAVLAQTDRHAGTFLADLADPAAIEQLIADVGLRLPQLDTLVLVAGADVLTGSPAKWSFEQKLDQLLRVDVVATMLLGSMTWRKGKNDFTPANKRLFYEMAANLLTELESEQ